VKALPLVCAGEQISQSGGPLQTGASHKYNDLTNSWFPRLWMLVIRNNV